MRPRSKDLNECLMILQARVGCVSALCEDIIKAINDEDISLSDEEIQIYILEKIRTLESVHNWMKGIAWDIKHLDEEEVAAPAEPVSVKNVEITFTPSSPFVGAPITCSQENENADKEDKA